MIGKVKFQVNQYVSFLNKILFFLNNEPFLKIFFRTIGYKKKYVRVPHGHIWVEGDHHGHSFDSNAFGPVSQFSISFTLCN